MARDISAGHVLVTERTLNGLKSHEVDRLKFELERILRSTRGNQPALDATQELQERQRKISRITGVQRMVNAYIQRSRRRAPK